MAYYLVLGVGVVVSFIFCMKRRNGYSVSNLIFKCVSSLCFLLTAVFALVSNRGANVYGSLIIFGGALGLVGDIALDLKGIYKKDESIYLQAGFIFFLIGHIFYSSAIIYSIKLKWWLCLISFAVAVLISIGNTATAKFMKIHFGAYRNIVFIYVIFLSLTMVLAIVTMFVSHFEKKYVLLAIGSVLFTLSDVVLSSTFFSRGKDGSFYLFINHFLYYAGQYLIASSVMFM
jgi:uncharacterized membrane protein YhhN